MSCSESSVSIGSKGSTDPLAKRAQEAPVKNKLGARRVLCALRVRVPRFLHGRRRAHYTFLTTEKNFTISGPFRQFLTKPPRKKTKNTLVECGARNTAPGFRGADKFGGARTAFDASVRLVGKWRASHSACRRTGLGVCATRSCCPPGRSRRRTDSTGRRSVRRRCRRARGRRTRPSTAARGRTCTSMGRTARRRARASTRRSSARTRRRAWRRS